MCNKDIIRIKILKKKKEVCQYIFDPLNTVFKTKQNAFPNRGKQV